MRLIPGALAALLALPAVALIGTPVRAEAAVPVVTLVSDSADLSTSQVVDGPHQNATDTANRQFRGFARQKAPATVTASQASASAAASQTTALSSTGATPLPLHPLEDISVIGHATTATTADATSPVVPAAVSAGDLSVHFRTNASVPVFFSGRLHTSDADANDACSQARVHLSGPVKRSFTASTGNACAAVTPHRVHWALSMTLPAGDYSLTVRYSSNLDDNADDKEPTSLAASSVASADLSFLPPKAAFSETLSGLRANFDGSRSSTRVAGRSLKTWHWNFGDGTTAVTTKPRVSHTFARSPRAAPAFRVSLQVVDSGHATSPAVRHTV